MAGCSWDHIWSRADCFGRVDYLQSDQLARSHSACRRKSRSGVVKAACCGRALYNQDTFSVSKACSALALNKFRQYTVMSPPCICMHAQGVRLIRPEEIVCTAKQAVAYTRNKQLRTLLNRLDRSRGRSRRFKTICTTSFKLYDIQRARFCVTWYPISC
jgi:hypothetical protein